MWKWNNENNEMKWIIKWKMKWKEIIMKIMKIMKMNNNKWKK